MSSARLISSLLLLFMAVDSAAQLTLADIFSENMVLQRGKPIPLWGKAAPGKSITVSFAGKEYNTTATQDGKWQIYLMPMAETTTPLVLTVISATDTLRMGNILIGDVWLCTGQSNMEYPLDRSLKRYAAPARGSDQATEEYKKPGKPDAVRYLYVERTVNKFPALPTKGWFNGTDTTIRYVSAAGYFFAKEIFENTGIPIGIISSSWGGTRVEQWTPPEAYRESGVFSKYMTSDTFKIDGMKPGQIYKGMIQPFEGLSIRGVCWYQGESNCMIEDQDTYVEKMRVFENNLRKVFNDELIPFFTVQISPYLYSARKDPKVHSPELLPLFQEAQTRCLQLSRTYMVVTTDLVDNLKDIHPSYKWEVGHRLALQALAVIYGKNGVNAWSPSFSLMKRKKNKLIVTLADTGGQLRSSDGKALNWFTVAGPDKKFFPAVVEIKGDQLIISSEQIRKPKYLRFAWDEKAQPNLVNAAGLPCIPFRTDKSE